MTDAQQIITAVSSKYDAHITKYGWIAVHAKTGKKTHVASIDFRKDRWVLQASGKTAKNLHALLGF